MSCNLLSKSDEISKIEQDAFSNNLEKDSNIGNDLLPVTACNNGVLDPGEVCDGEFLDRHSCKTERFSGGKIRCNNICELDFSECWQCNNGVLQFEEVCEDGDFNGKTCSSEFDIEASGELTCNECLSISSENCRPKLHALSSGAATICGIDSNNTVRCWGKDIDGQASPPKDEKFVKLSVGDLTSCGQTAAGMIRCWGSNLWNQIPPEEEIFSDFSMGTRTSCGIQKGRIFCWGLGGSDIPAGQDYVSLSVGDGHACAIKSDSTIQCWGEMVSDRRIAPTNRLV